MKPLDTGRDAPTALVPLGTDENSELLLEGTNLEEREAVMLQAVGHLQVLQDHRTIGEHPLHVVIMILPGSQQGQLITHPLTY